MQNMVCRAIQEIKRLQQSLKQPPTILFLMPYFETGNYLHPLYSPDKKKATGAMRRNFLLQRKLANPIFWNTVKWKRSMLWETRKGAKLRIKIFFKATKTLNTNIIHGLLLSPVLLSHKLDSAAAKNSGPLKVGQAVFQDSNPETEKPHTEKPRGPWRLQANPRPKSQAETPIETLKEPAYCRFSSCLLKQHVRMKKSTLVRSRTRNQGKYAETFGSARPPPSANGGGGKLAWGAFRVSNPKNNNISGWVQARAVRRAVGFW